jgi:hypothetical protein
MAGVRRRLWWYPTAIGLLLALFGLFDIASGAEADPAIAQGLTGQTLAETRADDPVGYRLFDFFTRTQGVLLAAFGVLFAVVAAIPYRAGRRWAWWAGWIFPSWTAGIVALYLSSGLAAGSPLPPPLVSGPILGGLAVLVLLVDRSRFWSASDGSA